MNLPYCSVMRRVFITDVFVLTISTVLSQQGHPNVVGTPYDPMSDPAFWKYFDLFSNAQAGTSTDNQQNNIMALVDALSDPYMFQNNVVVPFGIPGDTQSTSQNHESLNAHFLNGSGTTSDSEHVKSQASKTTNKNPVLKNLQGNNNHKKPSTEFDKLYSTNLLLARGDLTTDKHPASSNTLFRAAFSYPVADDQNNFTHSTSSRIRVQSNLDKVTNNLPVNMEKIATTGLNENLLSPSYEGKIKFMTLNTETDQLPSPPIKHMLTKAILPPPPSRSNMLLNNLGSVTPKSSNRKALMDKIASVLSNRQQSLMVANPGNVSGTLTFIQATTDTSKDLSSKRNTDVSPQSSVIAPSFTENNLDMGNIVPRKSFSHRLKILLTLYGDIGSVMSNPTAISYLLKGNPTQNDLMSLMTMASSTGEGNAINPLLMYHAMQQERSSDSTASSLPRKYISKQAMPKQQTYKAAQNDNLLEMLLLSGGSEGINPMILQQILLKQGSLSRSDILPLLLLSGGRENMLENPALLLTMLNMGNERSRSNTNVGHGDEQDGRVRDNAGQSMSSMLPMLLMGSEAFSENPLLMMKMLNLQQRGNTGLI